MCTDFPCQTVSHFEFNQLDILQGTSLPEPSHFVLHSDGQLSGMVYQISSDFFKAEH